jgi:hypothetical protein
MGLCGCTFDSEALAEVIGSARSTSDEGACVIA